MKPRKPEIDALRAVLMQPLDSFVTDKEAAEHKDPEGLAQTRMFTQALEAAEMARTDRTVYMVVLRHGTRSVHYTGFGPYATKAQAEKAKDELLKGMESTAYAVVPTRNQHRVAELWAEADADPGVRGDWAEVKKDQQAMKNGWRPPPGKKLLRARDRDNYLTAS